MLRQQILVDAGHARHEQDVSEQLPGEVEPVQIPAEAVPDHLPAEAVPDQLHAEVVIDQLPAEAVIDQLPAEAVPDQLPAEAVADQLPAEAVAVQLPGEAVADQQPPGQVRGPKRKSWDRIESKQKKRETKEISRQLKTLAEERNTEPYKIAAHLIHRLESSIFSRDSLNPN